MLTYRNILVLSLLRSAPDEKKKHRKKKENHS